jgi:flagellar FliL protein
MLSSKTFQDISTFEGKLQLRAELLAMLNQHLSTGMIINIYFTEFIVQ